jgi:D-alanine--poly(phosphoribitol) ligase subunit 2
MDKQEIQQHIFDLIEEISGDNYAQEAPDCDLFEEGLFDSLAAIEFLVRIEDELGVAIAPTELERDEMNTANKIIERVLERM